MPKNPSTRWFWNDWHNDKGLRACSLAARGAWIELLGPCAENGGYLLFDGKKPNLTDLARFLGTTKSKIDRAMRELEEHGVFSRTDEGIVFCRRMVRENGAKKNHPQAQKANGKLDEERRKLDVTRARASAPRSRAPQASSFKDSESNLDKPESLNGAREGKKISEGNPQARSARLGGSDERPCPDRERAGINETPARMGLVGANPGGTDDADTSLPPPVADPTCFGSGNQGRAYPLAGSASSPSTRLGALRGGDAEIAQTVERQDEALRVGGSTPPFGTFTPIEKSGLRSARPPPCRKSPALKAKIKEQLRQKHARFLAATCPNDIGIYWAACLADDATEGQRMFDAVDRRMRAAGWDDMREWRQRVTWKQL